MKLLRNVGTTTKAILLAGLLGACQTENDNALAPQTPATVTDKNAKTTTPPLLIKNGDDIIEYSYNGMGRPILTKVTFPTQNKYVIYSYAPQQISAQEYYINSGMKAKSFTYTLDSGGKCIESTNSGYTFGYEYNADGQLTKRYNKSLPSEKMEFIYEADFNANTKSLQKIKSYDKIGKSLRELQFSYSVPNKQIHPDLNPLNPQYLEGTTRYLTIFGKFATNLPRVIYDKYYSANTNKNYEIDYLMNVNSLPEKIYRSDLGGGNTVITELKYLAPLAGQ